LPCLGPRQGREFEYTGKKAAEVSVVKDDDFGWVEAETGYNRSLVEVIKKCIANDSY
jgi:hypothetical protein